MPDTNVLLTHPVLQPLWILALVMLVERLFNWPEKYHPLSFFRLLASNMDRKVRPGNTSSAMQNHISGSLAAIVLLLPFIIILAIIINIAEYPQFFDALLLLISLQFRPVLKRYGQIASALANNKKALARNLLSQMVLRETASLSPLGIAKAAIESLLLRFNYQYCSVIFWYLALGGLGAFIYRLLFEFSQSWNTKLPQYRQFGRPVSVLWRAMSWLPSRICAFCLAFVENPGGAFKASKSVKQTQKSSSRLLALQGGALAIQLGGPAIYQGRKVRFEKVGGQREVRFADMQRAHSGMNRSLWLVLALTLMICAAVYALSMKQFL